MATEFLFEVEMGAWGADHFANEDAMDWIADLTSVTDASVLRASFEPVLGAGDYIDASVGSVTLAAAEVVAALRGRPHSELPLEVVDWVEAFGPFDEPSLLDDARRAVRLISEDSERSELRQLWDEAPAEESTVWRREVADLQARLT